MIVDLAVAEQAKQAVDLFVADGTAKTYTVDVVDGYEYGGFIRHHAKVIKAARRPKNGFGFDALNNAESVIWVNDLVTNLECHTSPNSVR
jgi:hypothetical protein